METICRKCGNELLPVEICTSCSGPLKWQCEGCSRIKDSIHYHGAMPFSLAQ